jgi:hypothetical protein
MVNTEFPLNGGGNNGVAFQETPLQGLLVSQGNPLVTYSGAVTPGSTGNTLTFIIADANDSQLDTAAFIQGLGNAPPPTATPEPASVTLIGIGFACALGYARRRRKQAVA